MKLQIDRKRLGIAVIIAVVLWMLLTLSSFFWHGLTVQPTVDQMPGKGPAPIGDYWCAYRHGIYDKCTLSDFTSSILRDYGFFIILQLMTPLLLSGLAVGGWRSLLLLGALSPYLDIPLVAIGIYQILGFRKKS